MKATFSPRIRLFSYLIVISGIALLKNYIIMCVVICISSISALIFIEKYKKYFFNFFVIIPLFSLLIGFFAMFNLITAGNSIFEISENFYITDRGLHAFLNFILRIISISSVTGLYVMTASPGDFLNGLRALKFPDELLLLFLLTFRYIRIFAEDVFDFFNAKKLRVVAPFGLTKEIKWTGSRAFLLFRRGIYDAVETGRGLSVRGAIDGLKYPGAPQMSYEEIFIVITTLIITAGLILIDRIK
jgi:energy-coupling factor transporter transmembrane protein EcfT